MIAIKDMEMPSCCATCHVSEVDCKHKKTAFVRYSREDFAIPSDCPLVEIVTCKDCKYYRNEDDDEWCTNHSIHDNKFWVREDYYCGDGERRE